MVKEFCEDFHHICGLSEILYSLDMPASPTKQSGGATSKWAESPTKFSSPDGGGKRPVSVPARRANSPFKKSPCKEEHVTAPEVKEQAREVLERFLRRSLSENNAARGSSVRKYYKETTDLTTIEENRHSKNSNELASPTERRGSYVAAVSEDSSGRNDERKSNGSLNSLKSHSVSLTKAEKIKITEHLKLKKPVARGGLGDSLSPDTDGGEFSPNSTGHSKTSGRIERETSDDEDTVQKGRRKKSKFQQAKSRIRDSFLRKQREQSQQVPRAKPVGAQPSQSSYPKITKESPTPNGTNYGIASGNGTASRGQGSSDLEDESPTRDYGRSVHANSSPDGLNRINHPENKKSKPSFWDYFRPSKRKNQSKKERQKSRSLDQINHPQYSVQSSTKLVSRVFSDEGQSTFYRSVQKKHSFSGRCSFSEKTNTGLDRSELKLRGLRVNKPRTPDANDNKRVFPTDVVADGVDHVDAESPAEGAKNETDSEEILDQVADRLAAIANREFGQDEQVTVTEKQTVTRTVSDDGETVTQATSSLERNIASILRGAGDRHMSGEANEKIEKMMIDAAKNAGYTKFNIELQRSMKSEPNLQQLAWFFEVTKGAVQMAGVGGQLAVKVKEYSLRYFEDKFADWIIGRGGWDSMLSDEDGTGADDDGLNF